MNEGKEKEFDFHFQTPAAHGLSFRRLICNSAGQSLSELFNRNAPTPRTTTSYVAPSPS